MKKMHFVKKQILILFVFSALVSVGLIIHGVFFDLDFSQIQRLTLEGFVLTLVVIFPAILFLEWVFDLNNEKRFDSLERKINRKN